MSDFESQVTTMLRERAAAAQPMHRLDAVLDDMTEVRVVTPHRRDWRPLLAVAAALVLVVGGLVALTRRGADSSVAEPGPSDPKFSFVTQQVSLTADDFWIEVGGQRFTTVGAKVEVRSDPGDATYQTLELAWTEHDLPMGMTMYFQADGSEWSLHGFRTFNGEANGEVVTFSGDSFGTALGSAAIGNLDESAIENGITSHVHIQGMKLQAFRDRRPGGATVPTAAPATSVDQTTTIPVADRAPFAIGESVMFGARTQLEAAGFTVNAGESRQAYDVIELVAQMRAAARLGNTVVIHVGTNGEVTDADFAAIMANLPPEEVRSVWFLTVGGDRPWVVENNKRILALPAKHPNVSIGYWADIASTLPGMATDGIHLGTDDARRSYVDLIKAWTTGSGLTPTGPPDAVP
jgi:hypothetical protein